MCGSKRRQPALKPLEKIVQRLAVAYRVTDDRLNDRERIAHAMRQFAEQEPQPLLRRLAGSHITRAFKHQPAAVEGFQLDAAFDDEIVSAFRLLMQDARPV